MRSLFSSLRPAQVAVTAIMLIAGVPCALAQTNYGSVRGQIKDGTGAHIKDAQVTLTNLDTKVERATHTTDAGDYVFSAVDPGNYRITVVNKGFKSYEDSGLRVELGATTTIDASLQVGASGETIEVTSETPLLDTASASGGQLFSEQQIQDLPNLGRNPFVFEKFDSGVVTTGDPRYVRAEDQTGLSQVSLAGAPIGSNNYVVDGIPISTSSGGVTFIPSPEAVSDAKVQVNTYDAEAGRTGGGIFNTSLKSGSTQYHGSLYGETRQTPWSANLWFNPVNATTGLKGATLDNTTYLYAGAFGGPLPFMKKVKWLNNTFFWVTEEGYRQAQPLTGATTAFFLPTAAERNGDFSADGITLYDPTRGNPTGTNRTCQMTSAGDCSSGTKNVIPAAYINPIGKYILNQFPAPQSGLGYAAALAGPQNNFNNNITFKTRSDMYSGKLSHTFAPWWTASGSYVHLATQEPTGDTIGALFSSRNQKLLRYNDATAVNNTFTLTPTLLLTVGYGFNRYFSGTLQGSTGFNANTGFGGAGFPSALVNQFQSKTFPTIGISNIGMGSINLGASNSGPTINYSRNLVVGFTKTLNKHNVKFGYVFRAMSAYNPSTANGGGTFNFSGAYSNKSGGNVSGPYAYADILLGLPSTATAQVTAVANSFVENYHALYVQDDVRLTSKFTLNVGVRYEYELGEKERNNNFNVGFDTNISYAIPGSSIGTAKGGLRYAGQNGAPIHCCNLSHVKFSPRIGIAYQVLPKTVFHAGFGVFYAPIGIVNPTIGYAQTTSYAPVDYTTGAAAGVKVGSSAYLSTPFPTGLITPSGNSLGPLTSLGSSLATLQDFGRRFPFVQQYSADIQQELPGGLMFKLSYVGAHSRNIANSYNIDQASASQLANAKIAGVDLSSTVTNPYYVASVNSGGTNYATSLTPTVKRAQLLLPFPQFTGVTVNGSNGYSNYNSMAVKVQKRVSHGITLLSTYTWAANWDNLWSAASQIYSAGGPQDVFNPKAEYSRALSSVPNRMTAAISYELPFGRGKLIGSHANRFVDEFIGGWQVNDEWIVQNGVPLPISQTNMNSDRGVTGFGGSTQRPNLVGDAHDACRSGSPQGRLGNTAYGVSTKYLNANAFTPAQPYTFGSAPRLLPCRGPGINTTDMSVNKSFSIGEHVKAQFRAEALNAFNTPQFDAPNTVLIVSQNGINAAPTVTGGYTGATQLGNITNTVGFARIIQLGGKITF
ncbi:hypothetical protein Terro_4314 [Terriglobus roseus DSM 18391]|uniref:TonB-dependent transporter Oar-like beta-barrel domain-containing protein n=1 Tax=Terriglobus roseus (strain DSM 18391 / NRRL B-41598 / KBS 63) TaxID=926566 RepID=I3ZMP3_TERRK|nr:carboxypeptidase-like regulatory domain-containing protein [Terriglobus roseus]AFL90511.1 hypothetical protein Terro_4314 [Terriglobus roseus DSM 18391]